MTVIALGAGDAETCKSGSGGGSAETAGESQYGAAGSTSHLMQMNASYIVTDPKGTVLEECGKMLERGGYEIRVLNTINFKQSMRYNPFKYIYCENDILKLVNCIMENTKGEDSKGGEDFWASATRSHTNTIPQRIELCGR